MSEHFIKNIEIKNFKCFEDFKAEGFGRVNLIGGKNNVGKTAFMEACYLNSTSLKENSNSFILEMIEKIINIELHRNSLDFLLQWNENFRKFEFKYKESSFRINKISDDDLIFFIQNFYNEVSIQDRNNILELFYEKNLPPKIINLNFIAIGANFNNYLVNFIDEIKLADKEDELNQALKSFFDIEKIDIIKNKVMLKKESKYLLLSEFGDGVKHFLNIILALYLNKDSILYLDEIENGIHYSNYDRLWEIILTISKQQNVQVFATTHSKECIESYARVAKKLEDKEIAFIELCKREEEIKAFVYPYDWFIDEIEQEHEVRGCL